MKMKIQIKAETGIYENENLVYDDIPQHSYFEVIDNEDFVIGRGKT